MLPDTVVQWHRAGLELYESAPRLVFFDRDAKYGTEVPAAIRSMKIKSIRTSIESRWQNGVAERWVQSCRRDLLDHVIPLNERHLMRLLSDYGEEVHRRKGFPMVAQERKPAFRKHRISRCFAHPAGDGSLGNVEAEHKKFTMNPRCSIGRIFGDHPENQTSDLF